VIFQQRYDVAGKVWALQFGHMPAKNVPAGHSSSGSRSDKLASYSLCCRHQIASWEVQQPVVHVLCASNACTTTVSGGLNYQLQIPMAGAKLHLSGCKSTSNPEARETAVNSCVPA
jgi:hypothetical protein